MSTRTRSRCSDAAARLVAVVALVGASSVVGAPEAGAFSLAIHRQITHSGLGAGSTAAFLRPAVQEEIDNQHDWMDAGFPSFRVGDDEKHFDDCEFDGGAAFIRQRYENAAQQLSAIHPWTAAEQFGRALHPVQDFYSHSNWVELGFPRTDDPATEVVEVAQSDLVDLSGAQTSPGQQWNAPAGGAVVRDDILLGGDDWPGIPPGWSIPRNGGGLFVPTLVDQQGVVRGRLLESGQSAGDDECDVPFIGLPFDDAYTGISHDNLNKDSVTATDPAEKKLRHAKARALATLQTGYEWCRLVRAARLADRDGLLLALWVREGADPHPPGTPCGPAAAGTVPIVVTVEDVRILSSKESGGQGPGEIQLAAALYEDPADFRRSVHAANSGGPMALDSGQSVPHDRLPDPLTLCTSPGRAVSFALHAWENDDSGGPFAQDFDNDGDDDDVLQGIRRDFDDQLPSGSQTARSSDLEVTYRVGRASGAALLPCLQVADPT